MSKLISGKEALIALANGENLQYRFPDGIWMNFTNNLNTSGSPLRVVDLLNDYACFRIKSSTITVNGIEVPAPFNPKEGEVFYYINDYSEDGYDWANSCSNLFNNTVWIGKWRSEDEIKQVIAALRSVFNTK